MQYLVNSREMKQCDKNTTEYYGVSSMVLMERAALAVFSEIQKRFSKEDGKVLVLCGNGNNGGDGIAVARLLHLAGWQVEMLLPMKGKKMTPETERQYDTAGKYYVPETDHIQEHSYAVVVDALFGIGLSRGIEGNPGRILEAINKMPAFRIAVDIASGVLADTGAVPGAAFCADLTVTFGFAKIGQFLYPGAEYTGELITADIGIDKNGFQRQNPSGKYLNREDLSTLLPKRRAYSNKGSYGKTLIIAGSSDMAGAAYFAAKAAYYSGCGLVRIFTAKENREILLTKLPEAIITTYEAEQIPMSKLKESMEWADAVLIGPGLSRSPAAQMLVESVLSCESKKIVFDADALNIISKDTKVLKNTCGERVITPHLGEMSRLTGKNIKSIQENLLQVALDFAKEYHVFCVLKDARTVIGMPDGEFFVNTTGNHGMATGGSGDVLSGFITGFLAQGLSCEKALPAAVYLHGMAGDLAAEAHGAYSMVASDLLEMIPEAVKSSGKE